MEKKSVEIKESRIRNIALSYYSRSDVLEAMYKFSNKMNLEYKIEEFYQGLASINKLFPDIPIIFL